MTWTTFFAGRDDLMEFFRFVYADTDCQVFEAYSRPDQTRREFPDVASLAEVPELGLSPGPHLAVWSPGVGPAPVVRRIDFKPGAVPGHTHRFVTEGCGLVTLLCGGVRDRTLDATRMGWWTRASALNKAMPHLAPESVSWPVLAQLARKLRYHIERRLSRAVAGKRAVLPQATELARNGFRLRDGNQPLVEFTLDAR